jgi:hypothetical protein
MPLSDPTNASSSESGASYLNGTTRAPAASIHLEYNEWKHDVFTSPEEETPDTAVMQPLSTGTVSTPMIGREVLVAEPTIINSS